MKNIAIIEDDKKSADILIENICKFEKGVGEQFSVRYFDEPIGFLEGYKSNYDLIFLDIELPHLNGMDVARKIRATDKNTIIVFITNMAQYAVDGYEVNALDFIVKPINYAVFSFKMQRVMDCMRAKERLKLKINVGTGVECLSAEEIMFIEVMNHKLTYYTTDRAITAYGQLKSIEEKVPANLFCRCNSYCLVNLKYVVSVKGLEVEMEGGKVLSLTRGKRKEFLRLLAEYLGGLKYV